MMHRAHDAPQLEVTWANYVSLSAQTLWSESAGLLLATLVALVCAAPWLAAVALDAEMVAPLTCALFGAPAWAGLVAAALAATRGDGVSIGRMLRAISRVYPRSTLLGAATAGFAGAFERVVAKTAHEGVGVVPLLAAVSAVTVLVLVVDAYAFPLLAMENSKLYGTLRTALALAVTSPVASVAMLASGVLACVALAAVGPGSLLLSLPAMAVLHVNNTLLQMELHRSITDYLHRETPAA